MKTTTSATTTSARVRLTSIETSVLRKAHVWKRAQRIVLCRTRGILVVRRGADGAAGRASARSYGSRLLSEWPQHAHSILGCADAELAAAHQRSDSPGAEPSHAVVSQLSLRPSMGSHGGSSISSSSARA